MARFDYQFKGLNLLSFPKPNIQNSQKLLILLFTNQKIN